MFWLEFFCCYGSMLPYRALVRVFITDLDFMAVMHRFLICFTKNRRRGGVKIILTQLGFLRS